MQLISSWRKEAELGQTYEFFNSLFSKSLFHTIRGITLLFCSFFQSETHWSIIFHPSTPQIQLVIKTKKTWPGKPSDHQLSTTIIIIIFVWIHILWWSHSSNWEMAKIGPILSLCVEESIRNGYTVRFLCWLNSVNFILIYVVGSVYLQHRWMWFYRSFEFLLWVSVFSKCVSREFISWFQAGWRRKWLVERRKQSSSGWVLFLIQ